ncbi:PTS sugar transporter subunit IIA [Salinithrix halophila]|uniref:PTS glucose transporter subunit IIA n=1 Tax=Salinithrix halophila TaxID=1485204 RepID=A0ABV8JG58_9BACL
MFKNWLKKKNKELTLTAPMSGKGVPIADVPDPVFSGKMMGDGMAVDPSEGILTSPVDGEVVQLFHTAHAIGIRTKEGVELLLHIGLETVSMEGEGFTARVAVGDKVKTGQPLIEFDLEKVREIAASTVTPVVITNMDHVEQLETLVSGEVQSGEPMLKVILK